MNKKRNSLSPGRISGAHPGHMEIIGSPSKCLHFVLSDAQQDQEKSAFISQRPLWRSCKQFW